MTRPLIPAVIYDMDGTLVDVSGIRHYVLGKKLEREYSQFHTAASYAPPMPHVADLARALHAHGLASLVITARGERWRYRARVWLRKWDVPVDALGMRGHDDLRSDVEVKRELYAQARDLGYEPVLAFDDRPSVVALWRSLEIPTVVVPGWVGDDPQAPPTGAEPAPVLATLAAPPAASLFHSAYEPALTEPALTSVN